MPTYEFPPGVYAIGDIARALHDDMRDRWMEDHEDLSSLHAPLPGNGRYAAYVSARSGRYRDENGRTYPVEHTFGIVDMRDASSDALDRGELRVYSSTEAFTLSDESGQIRVGNRVITR